MDAVKLLGSLMGNNATGGNMLGELLKGAMGGGQQRQQQQQPSGAGDMLGALAKSAMGGGSGGGLLGSLLGGGGSSGGAGSLLGSLLGGGGGSGGAASLISGLLGGGSQEAAPQATAPPVPQNANDQAALLIRAMCNAAKADGEIDEKEQQAIVGRLGNDVDEAEAAFLRKELSTPLDVAEFARSVPRDLAVDVYALSVMTVLVDTRQEAAYLQQLAGGLGLDNQTLGQIHQQLGLA